jgi:hypothetical protein
MIATNGRSLIGGFNDASMASISFSGTGGASAAADVGGKLKTQAPNPANESVMGVALELTFP